VFWGMWVGVYDRSEIGGSLLGMGGGLGGGVRGIEVEC
jgi:hypothetical protein